MLNVSFIIFLVFLSFSNGSCLEAEASTQTLRLVSGREGKHSLEKNNQIHMVEHNIGCLRQARASLVKLNQT